MNELDRIYELLEMYGYDEEFIANFDPQTKDAEIVIDILQQDVEKHYNAFKEKSTQ